MKKIIYIFILFAFACSSENTPSTSKSDSSAFSNEGGSSGTGIGGSTARFTIVGDYLYIATTNTLYAFNISNPEKPELKSETELNAFTETIFSLDNQLLLGTQSGVLIYSLTNPEKPLYRSIFEHITSCDPVVAKGNFAYSTLRMGTGCNRGVNRLDVIDISNLSNPILTSSLTMNNPTGLGISGDYLFVCDNNELARVDISNPNNIQEQKRISLLGCYDVIPVDNRLIVATENGILQFEVAIDGNLTLLSTIVKE